MILVIYLAKAVAIKKVVMEKVKEQGLEREKVLILEEELVTEKEDWFWEHQNYLTPKIG